MQWPEVILAVVNSAQVVLLAWIASRQLQTRQELKRYNGTVERHLQRIEQRQ